MIAITAASEQFDHEVEKVDNVWSLITHDPACGFGKKSLAAYIFSFV